MSARCAHTGSSVRVVRARWSCTRSPKRAEFCSRPFCRRRRRAAGSARMPEHAPLMQLGEARPLTVPFPAGPAPVERARLERRTRLLAWGGIAWHVVEFAIAIAAGLAAGSIALIGFGADSLIEALAGGVVFWLFTGNRRGSSSAERRAQQLIAVSFFVLAAYVGVEALRTLIGGHEPHASWLGIGLAAFTAPTMPLLSAWKRRVGRKLNSSAACKESPQPQL